MIIIIKRDEFYLCIQKFKQNFKHFGNMHKKLHSFTIAPLSSKLAHKKTKIVIEILYDTDK